MIFFVVQQYHEYTIGNFLEAWARPLAERVGILNWADLAQSGRLHRGTYVLCDFERLSRPQWDLARLVGTTLTAANCRVLNHPDRVLDRAALLRRLHAEGINQFQAYRVGVDDPSAVRFPCFVRRTSAHMGNVSPLLHDRPALRSEIARQQACGHDDLLIIEFLDTVSRDPSDHGGGLYRKYGLLRVGDAMTARHQYTAQKWVVGSADVVEDWAVQEEARYIADNPHADPLGRVFDLAGIDYGRVDYAMLEGRPQVWEINTNPMLLASPHRIAPARLPAQARGAEATARAIAAVDDGVEFDPSRSANWIPLELPASLRQKLGGHRADAALRAFGKLMGQIGRAPGVRQVLQVCQRAQRLANDDFGRFKRAA